MVAISEKKVGRIRKTDNLKNICYFRGGKLEWHGIWHNWFLLGISPESPNHSSYSRCGDSAAEQIRVHSTEG